MAAARPDWEGPRRRVSPEPERSAPQGAPFSPAAPEGLLREAQPACSGNLRSAAGLPSAPPPPAGGIGDWGPQPRTGPIAFGKQPGLLVYLPVRA